MLAISPAALSPFEKGTDPALGIKGRSVMSSPLTKRLEEFTSLVESDRAAIERLSRGKVKTVDPRRDLVKEGENPRCVYLILDGWGCHYRILRNGRRQIVDFAIPGDLCNLNVYILEAMDTSVAAITQLSCAEIQPAELEDLTSRHPKITQALWWQELVTKSIHREWIVNIGQRSAQERIAHLLCEMYLRMESVGLTSGRSCDFPLVQADIGDATGLTTVHVNRTLQELRRLELIELRNRMLCIPDMGALMSAGLFSPDYLHLARLKRHCDQDARWNSDIELKQPA